MGYGASVSGINLGASSRRFTATVGEVSLTFDAAFMGVRRRTATVPIHSMSPATTASRSRGAAFYLLIMITTMSTPGCSIVMISLSIHITYVRGGDNHGGIDEYNMPYITSTD